MKTQILIGSMLAMTALLAAAPTVSAHESYCYVEDFACTCSSHWHGTDQQRCSGTYNNDCDNSYGAHEDYMVGTGCDNAAVIAELLEGSGSEVPFTQTNVALAP